MVNMKIETKYGIGQRIWIVYEHQGEVHIYDDFIASVGWEDYLYYMTKEACEEVKEKEIVLYEDTEKLVNKIKECMEKIREKEGKE